MSSSDGCVLIIVSPSQRLVDCAAQQRCCCLPCCCSRPSLRVPRKPRPAYSHVALWIDVPRPTHCARLEVGRSSGAQKRDHCRLGFFHRPSEHSLADIRCPRRYSRRWPSGGRGRCRNAFDRRTRRCVLPCRDQGASSTLCCHRRGEGRATSRAAPAGDEDCKGVAARWQPIWRQYDDVVQPRARRGVREGAGGGRRQGEPLKVLHERCM